MDSWWQLGEGSGHRGESLATHQITCPFCMERGNFEIAFHAEKKKANSDKKLNFDTLKCGNCSGYVMVLWSAGHARTTMCKTRRLLIETAPPASRTVCHVVVRWISPRLACLRATYFPPRNRLAHVTVLGFINVSATNLLTGPSRRGEASWRPQNLPYRPREGRDS